MEKTTFKKTKKRVKVPMIMQMEMLECGAASLAMILAYYKKWVPLEKVREDCAVSRDGSTAKYMLMAAGNYGLISKGFKGDVEKLKKAPLPCVIHWNFSHFVVLTGFSKRHVYINDPATGETKVPLEIFDKSFTGVYMTFKPGDDFKPEGRPPSVISFARSCLKGTLTSVAFVVATVFLTSIIGVITLVISRVFLDRVLTGCNPDWVTLIIILMICLTAISFIVSLINALYLLKIRGKLTIVGNSKFLWHVLKLPMSFFSQRLAGDISGRLKYNETIAETLITRLAPLVLNFLLAVFYLVIMARYSLVLTAIGFLAVIANMLMARTRSRTISDLIGNRSRWHGENLKKTFTAVGFDFGNIVFNGY